MSNQEDYKGEFDNWVDQWTKAQADGIFNDAPKRDHRTPNLSFFGMSDINPDAAESADATDDPDGNDWNQIYALSTGNQELISESIRLSKKEMGEKADRIANSANPIRQSSEGKDQDVTDKALNGSILPEDVQKLDGMKRKLHELENKIAKLDNNKGVTAQIDSLKKQIDDLSDQLTSGYDISSQGD